MGARSDWLGPTPWSVVAAAVAEIGLTAVQRPGGRGVQGTFTDGWLRLEDAPEGLIGALHREIARLGGRDVDRVAWRATASRSPTGASVRATVDRSEAAPEGVFRVSPRQQQDLQVAADASSVDERALGELLVDAEGVVVAPRRPLDGPLAHLHPDLRWRDLTILLPTGWRPRPAVDVRVGGVPVAGAVVARTLAKLGLALDDGPSAPELGRWGPRAARRAGLPAPPAPGGPGWSAYHPIWLELTREERGRPGRPGTVAGWRLRTVGHWILPREECALLLAAAPAKADAWGAALAAGAAGAGCELEVRAPEGGRTPWCLECPSLRSDGALLVVTLGDRVLVEAVAGPDGPRVSWTDGLEPEIAASHLRAALRGTEERQAG